MIRLLRICNKTIDQIQSILQSKKLRNISQQANGNGIANLAIAFRDKNITKKKVNNKNECYNCYKLGHFKKNFLPSNRRLNKNISQFWKNKLQKRNLCRDYYGKNQNNSKTISNQAYQVLKNQKSVKMILI